jgi:hypothetical protein
MAIIHEDMGVVIFLMRRFSTQKTYQGIRQAVEENGGYASLLSVLDPVTNRVPESTDDEHDQVFDSVVLKLLKEACPNLVFICGDLVDLHWVSVKPDGTPSNEDYTIVVSKKNGSILFYGKNGRYVHATLDVGSCLNQVTLRGFPVEWI